MMKDVGTIFEKGNNEGLSIYNCDIIILNEDFNRVLYGAKFRL